MWQWLISDEAGLVLLPLWAISGVGALLITSSKEDRESAGFPIMFIPAIVGGAVFAAMLLAVKSRQS